MKSLGHAFDFRETWREIRDGWLDMWDRMRKRESRYDMSVRRAAHLESALGVTRSHGAEKGRAPREDLNLGHTELDRAERQWLGIGDNHDYTLSPITREKSGDLEYQIERELERRGVEPGRSLSRMHVEQCAQLSFQRHPLKDTRVVLQHKYAGLNRHSSHGGAACTIGFLSLVRKIAISAQNILQIADIAAGTGLVPGTWTAILSCRATSPKIALLISRRVVCCKGTSSLDTLCREHRTSISGEFPTIHMDCRIRLLFTPMECSRRLQTQ